MARGRPTKNSKDRHDHIYPIRLNDEEWRMLQYLKNIPDLNVAAELRSVIANLYGKHYVYPPTEFEVLCAETLTPALLKSAEYIHQDSQVFKCDEEGI